MVQIHGPSRKALLRESLGQSIGQGLSNFVNNYFAGKALDDVTENPGFKDAPTSEKASQLERAMRPFGEYGVELLKNRIGIEQQAMQEQEQKVLGKIAQGKDVSDEEVSRLTPDNQFKAIQARKTKAIGNQIKQSLLKAGYDDETASLWASQMEAAPTGGQTDVIKSVNDLIKRSPKGKGMSGEGETTQLKPSIDVPGIENKSYDLDFPEIVSPISRTSADLVKEEAANKKINTPLYSKTIDSLNALDEDFRDITQLQEYNEKPGALPTGLEKWNVDWDTGDLRVKALSTPETQGYVKIIARLLGRAKEFFPGRVTNFDLNQFRQRFPTLANSPEGRRLIAKQLALANRIAYLKDETLKASMDHYGSGGDTNQIRKQAQSNYRRLKGELENELKGLNDQADELSKEKKRKEFTPQIGAKFLKQAKGNLDEAKRLAKEEGYD